MKKLCANANIVYFYSRGPCCCRCVQAHAQALRSSESLHGRQIDFARFSPPIVTLFDLPKSHELHFLSSQAPLLVCLRSVKITINIQSNHIVPRHKLLCRNASQEAA
jgi:hypothetical protein